jgi:integrase
MRSPSNDELESAAVQSGYDMIREYEAGRRLEAARVGGEHWQRYQRRTAINVSSVDDGAAVRSIADAAIEDLGFDLAPDSEGYAKLCEYLGSARHTALDTSYRVAHGEVTAESDGGGIVERVRQRTATKAQPGETMLELFERWASEMLDKGEKRSDTINQDRKVIARFAAFVGADRDVRSITPVEVAEYRDSMRDLPPKWMSNKDLRDHDMRAAAALAREKGLPKSAFTNVNKHLSTISPLYRWLGAQPAWAGLQNPCAGLFYAKVKGKNRRPSFKTAALNKILGSPLFKGFEANGKEHQPGEVQADDWRRWIPLVAMFTGARIGEIAQLRIGDVRQDRDVWFVHICHDEGEGVSTKSGKSRAAPVHPMLEGVGFLAFRARQLERAGDDLDAPLFPELERNVRGQISATPSRWWREYLEAIGVKDGGDGFGAHSFRHTLADRLRDEAELMDDQVAVILGHSISTTTSGYGELPQGTVNMLKGWIDGVRFDGVKFDHLIETDVTPSAKA